MRDLINLIESSEERRGSETRVLKNTIRADRAKIDIGQVCTDIDGRDWVFIGWTRNTSGLLASFIQVVDGLSYARASDPNLYGIRFIAEYDTLVKYFPSLDNW